MAKYHRPLRQYIDNKVRVLAQCRRCEHAASFDAATLARRWGDQVDPWQLPFRCRRCRSRDVRVSPDLYEAWEWPPLRALPSPANDRKQID